LVDVLLPSLGESVTEGIVIKWMKKIGDHVDRDEPICEISTDKVDSEMPSPAAGVLLKIVANEGDTVEVGALLAVIGDSADAVATPTTPAASPSPVVGVQEPVTRSVSSVVQPATSSATTQARGPAGVIISPVVRRILNDAGVDPRSISGSGPGGSITRRDAEAVVANGPNDDVSIPLSNGRRRMAEHMVLSAQSTPHGFVAVEVEGAVLASLNAVSRLTRDGDPIPDEAVVAIAAVRALGEFPSLNSTFAESEVVQHRTINLGFARHGDRDGMLVPVVHAAAGLTLRALARRLADLDQRLQTRQLTTDDLMGGTFTLMGAPSVHTLLSQPIIIQPQVAVLSVGALRTVAVVVHRGDAQVIEVGHRIVLSLTFDHRVSDTASAAAYLERVGELLASIDIDVER
jgi:pyruvate dehydrogenase E2 component (dihydrolipoamide acetyltransferase)